MRTKSNIFLFDFFFCGLLETIMELELESLQEMNASQIVSKVAYGALPLFYLVPPSQSSFQTIPEVPDYVRKVSVRLHYKCTKCHSPIHDP